MQKYPLYFLLLEFCNNFCPYLVSFSFMPTWIYVPSKRTVFFLPLFLSKKTKYIKLKETKQKKSSWCFPPCSLTQPAIRACQDNYHHPWLHLMWSVSCCGKKLQMIPSGNLGPQVLLTLFDALLSHSTSDAFVGLNQQDRTWVLIQPKPRLGVHFVSKGGTIFWNVHITFKACRTYEEMPHQADISPWWLAGAETQQGTPVWISSPVRVCKHLAKSLASVMLYSLISRQMEAITGCPERW